MKKLKVGIVGTGNISGIYFKGGYRFKNYELVSVADIIVDKPKAKLEEVKGKAEEWKVKIEKLPVVQTVEELLKNPEVELVLNLTVPKAHAEVALKALEAGKHTYSEKPFSVTREDGMKIMALAKKKNLKVGCAPDTFLGGGHQTCRKLVDEGWIGRPVAATCFMMCPGHETWHPDPEFYYQVGGGPMFDMGPYYLTALINMFGPAKRVAGMGRIAFPERTITSSPKYGKVMKVETPTHVTGTIEFVNGAIATLIMSFDIQSTELPCIEVYGTRGTLHVPDPNGFGGMIKFRAARAAGWSEIPSLFGYMDNSRGIGVCDMASALATGRGHRASGDLACHVLDIMAAFLDSASSGKMVELTTTCARPAALPMGLREGEID